MTVSDTYPGGKGGQGVYHRIISELPPHARLIELFAGHAAISRLIRPATRGAVLVDADPRVVAWLVIQDRAGWRMANMDALAWLDSYAPQHGDLIYADPPYLRGVRRSGHAIYEVEFDTCDAHQALLSRLHGLSIPVAISHYACPLYRDLLPGWRTVEFRAATRGRVATETLWLNFPPPVELHDYRFIGADYRDRWNMTRRVRRWTARLARMDRHEHLAMMAALHEAQARDPYSSVRLADPWAGHQALASAVERAYPPQRGHTHTQLAALDDVDGTWEATDR